MQDLRDFKIEKTIKELGLIKKETWKEFIKLKGNENAIKYLNSKIGTKSHKYKELKISNFLSSQSEVPIETAKFIAKIQTHMVENVKMNFQGNYQPNFVCNSCHISECNQFHLLYCKELIGSNQLLSYIPDYEDIFNDNDPKEQCFIAEIMKENLKRKKELEGEHI